MSEFIFRIVPVSRPMLLKFWRDINLSLYAIAGAWFFAIVSAVPLVWLMIEGHGDDGAARVFGTEVNGVVHSIWGLTYAGFFGSVLLWLEFFALAAAIVMTALPTNCGFARPDFITRMRHIGLSYLTGWAGLWMIGTMYLAIIDPGFLIIQALFIATLFGCTLYRTVSEWTCQPTSAEVATPSIQTGSKHRAGPDISPLTDVADISRFMLHRSAVRHSERVIEREVDHPTSASRMLNAKSAPPRTAHDDDYGAALRGAVERAARFMARGIAEGAKWLRRSARIVKETLRNGSRSTRSA